MIIEINLFFKFFFLLFRVFMDFRDFIILFRKVYILRFNIFLIIMMLIEINIGNLIVCIIERRKFKRLIYNIIGVSCDFIERIVMCVDWWECIVIIKNCFLFIIILY